LEQARKVKSKAGLLPLNPLPINGQNEALCQTDDKSALA